MDVPRLEHALTNEVQPQPPHHRAPRGIDVTNLLHHSHEVVNVCAGSIV